MTMQRRAASAYLALFLVVTAGAYGVTVATSPPPIDVNPDHELRADESVQLSGTEYAVSELNASAPSATLERDGGNESTELTEGTNVTLGGTTYTAHFEGRRLQLTGNQAAYMDEVREVREHETLMHDLEVLATLSGITAIVLGAAAFMPVRGD
jgi:hypothetical protein